MVAAPARSMCNEEALVAVVLAVVVAVAVAVVLVLLSDHRECIQGNSHFQGEGIRGLGGLLYRNQP